MSFVENIGVCELLLKCVEKTINSFDKKKSFCKIRWLFQLLLCTVRMKQICQWFRTLITSDRVHWWMIIIIMEDCQPRPIISRWRIYINTVSNRWVRWTWDLCSHVCASELFFLVFFFYKIQHTIFLAIYNTLIIHTHNCNLLNYIPNTHKTFTKYFDCQIIPLKK